MAGSDAAAELYKERAKMQQRDGREFIAEISPKPGDTVLDLGCGTGELTAYLAELVGPSGKVTGVDPDGARIKLAQETYQHVKNLTFAVGSCGDFPDVGMARYDLVFSNFVFHWIFDKEKALGTLFQSLKPGGKIAVQCVSAMPLLAEKVIEELFAERSEGIWAKWCLKGKDVLESYQLRNGFEMLTSSEFVRRESFPSLVDFCKWLEGVTHGEAHLDSVPEVRMEQMIANMKTGEKEEFISVEHFIVRTIAVRPGKVAT